MRCQNGGHAPTFASVFVVVSWKWGFCQVVWVLFGEADGRKLESSLRAKGPFLEDSKVRLDIITSDCADSPGELLV